MEKDFEQAFGDFLDRKEYDDAESALFSMVRVAFTAGWLAAGGEPMEPQNVIEIVKTKIIDISPDNKKS